MTLASDSRYPLNDTLYGEVIQLLNDGLKDPNGGVKHWAIIAIEQLKITSFRDTLLNMASQYTLYNDNIVHLEIIHTLGVPPPKRYAKALWYQACTIYNLRKIWTCIKGYALIT
jgi:hypothetical protein